MYNIPAIISYIHEFGSAVTGGHGYTSGGWESSSTDIIDKFSFTTDGNASDVGDLTIAREAVAGQSYK